MNTNSKTYHFQMVLRLSSAIAAAIDEAAHELRTTRSDFIRESIRRNLDYFTDIEAPLLRESRRK